MTRALHALGLALVAVGLVAAKVPMPKWCCTGCGLRYGEPGKAKYGYCAMCWDVWTAEQRLNVARAQLAWQRVKMERYLETGAAPCPS